MLTFVQVSGVPGAVFASNQVQTWQVGMLKPELVGKCVQVQADGGELDYLLNMFHNIPIARHGGAIIWKGEWAQFIYDNLTGI